MTTSQPDGVPSRRAERHRIRPTNQGGDAVKATLAATYRLIGRDTFPQTFAHAASDIQRPIATGRRIVVCAPAKGAGTTTIATAMASTLHALRNDLVCLIDLTDPDPTAHDTTDHRTLTPTTALGALAVTEPATREDFRRTMRMAPDVTALSLRQAPTEPTLSGSAVHALIAGCTRHCSVTIIVAPPGLEDPQAHAAFASAHAAVVVTDRKAANEGAAHSFVSLLSHLHPHIPFVELMNEPTKMNRKERRRPTPGSLTMRHAQGLRLDSPPSFSSLREPETADLLTLTAHAMTMARTGRTLVEGGRA